ncbi:TetR/AcrR family transcriptional regulator [Sphaerisporangium perillae]|uniref:TetR/AcrR family transcriptional regulator n=1 Tax=Sphaerisporangium perillae TaxID=2935860 RepID=UPI00200D5554|nr:TetR/AcrR family transcriptional regulator [Sphaerisporangium perillae]
MRADARRNLDKIVTAAAAVVAERGIEAPMEVIARRAGVGVGTLYRRFPDRNALIAALGDHYVHSLADALRRSEENVPDAWTALREHLTWTVDPGRGALASAMAELPDEVFLDRPDFARARGHWLEMLDALVHRAQAEGAMRPDVTTEEVLALLNLFACHPADLPAAVAARPARFLRLILDGLQATAATEPPTAPA